MDVFNSERWHKRFLRLAYQVAAWSKDTSSQVGSVIVSPDGEPRSFGFNGMPRGIDDSIPERHERPEKYMWFEHAERNAIYQAGDIKGCIIFITHMPCPDCCRAIIQSGIKHVYVAKNNGVDSDFVRDRIKSLEISLPMLKEAGIVYQEVEVDVKLQSIDNEWFVVPLNENSYSG